MKKRALCPLSGVHLTIKPKIHTFSDNTIRGWRLLMSTQDEKKKPYQNEFVLTRLFQ